MSTFVLKILFSGLMAFIPNENGTEVTVLLLNSNHYHTSDGAAMAPHEQVIYVKAGDCSGDCVNDDPDIAKSTYRELSASAAEDALAYALDNGSAWRIAGSDVSVQKSSGAANLPALNIVDDVRGTTNSLPNIIPSTSGQARDISWIPQLDSLCASGCSLNSDLLDTVPPEIVAARFKINSGDLYTYSVARLGSDVTPVQFKRLDGSGSASSYVQAITSWTGLDIEVTGDSVDFVESRYDSEAGRTMTVSPDENGVVEVAVMNMPPSVPPSSSINDAPQVGKHFEMYYELLQSPPDRETRLVPSIGAPTDPAVTWSSVHPSISSELLSRLQFEPGRSLYDRTICPPVRIDG